jgi:hypothetical protein
VRKTKKRLASEVREVPVGDLAPAAVNATVYRPVDPSDPEVQRLADTIRQHGILTPLTVTTDGVILSGHRRHCAAQLAGLATVPVIVDPMRSDDPGFLQRLVVANEAREKTLAEAIREAVVTQATPEEAYAELRLSRARRALGAVAGASNRIYGGAVRKRSKISKGRLPFLEATVRAIESLRDFWPLSDRTIHYQLLNDPPMRWTKPSKRADRPDEPYRNDKRSYDDLTKLLTQARFEGAVPFESIHDPTRPVTQWAVSASAGQYVKESAEEFLTGYARDLLQSQPNHVEVVAEKNTLASILRPVCAEYTVPLTIGRGYCSVPPRKAIADRFEQSGKELLVLVILSDHDPDGEMIAESFVRSMRDDFGLPPQAIRAVRAALAHEQVAALGLPPNKERAKETSSNYARYVKRFGEEVYELEAVPPRTLQQMLRDALESVIDREAFDHEVANEQRDAKEIADRRAALMAAMAAL